MVVDVVAGLVKKDGKFLIAKRIWGNETSVNRFEFPGGKVEPGEDYLQAIERELREEMTIEALKLLDSFYKERLTRGV